MTVPSASRFHFAMPIAELVFLSIEPAQSIAANLCYNNNDDISKDLKKQN